MSVVGSDWEDLKRYNLAELYGPSAEPGKGKGEGTGTPLKAEAKPQRVTTDEAPAVRVSRISSQPDSLDS